MPAAVHVTRSEEKDDDIKIIYTKRESLLMKQFNSSTVFLISSYGAPLAQRASYLAINSSFFGPDGAVNYDYIVTNSINWLKMYSQWCYC